MNLGIGTAQMAEQLGVSMRKIISYTERGYVQASVLEANGHGSKRIWSSVDYETVKALTFIEPLLRCDVVRTAMAHPGEIATKLRRAAQYLENYKSDWERDDGNAEYDRLNDKSGWEREVGGLL